MLAGAFSGCGLTLTVIEEGESSSRSNSSCKTTKTLEAKVRFTFVVITVASRQILTHTDMVLVKKSQRLRGGKRPRMSPSSDSPMLNFTDPLSTFLSSIDSLI